MSDSINYSEDNFEHVYVVGIRLWPDSHQADCFTLVLYNEVARNDQNRPLTSEGRILFFRSIHHANAALRAGDKAFRKYEPIKIGVAYVYDIPKVLATVASAEADDDGIVADFVNELLDFIAATNRNISVQHRAALHALADFTTFDKDLRGMPNATSTREMASEALLWGIGTVLSCATVLRPPTRVLEN